MRISCRKIAYFALLTAMAIVLGYVERMIPILDGSIPGVKLGLSNVVILFGIYVMGTGSAFLLVILKVFLLGMMFTGLFSTTMMVSLGGGLVSWLVMVLIKKVPGMSVVSVSLFGAVAHNFGQTLTAGVLMNTYTLLITYLPMIIVSAVITGILTGLVGSRVIDALHRTGVIKHMLGEKAVKKAK